MDIETTNVQLPEILADSVECNQERLTVSAPGLAVANTKSPSATSAPNTANAKSLPNIQPKVASSHGVSFQRQIVPKNDVAAQPMGQPTAVQTNQQNNIIIPQGIQHVLINGQLYPIIQTANGTHLLIQQPVGQIQQQNGGKQVFTAQPIQLANSQAAVPAQPTSNGTQSAGTIAKEQALNSAPSSSATSNQNSLSSQKTSPSKAISNPVPSSGQPTQQAAPVRGGAPSAPVTVNPQTQQILTKIQNQIEALKPKAESDPTSKSNLQQLQQIQQQILRELQNQMQRTISNSTMSNGQSQPIPQGASPAQVLQHGAAMVTAQQLIIQPVKDGESPMTSNNLISLASAFTNVKVGAQVYNIQLTEEQKKFMIEKMNKMAASDQHEFVRQQQLQILQQALRSNTPSALPPHGQHATPSQPPVPQPSRLETPNQRPSSPRPTNKLRTRRRANHKSKIADDSPIPSPASTVDENAQSANKGRATPVRRSRHANLSSKRIGERMLGQIQKDQEVLLKAGSHKKLFHNKNQLSERLLRYHIYYTDDKLLYSRRLQEAELFDSIANKMVLRKEELTDRFRFHLWEDSIKLAPTEEDRLVAELLLEDERHSFEEDKLLEQTDIERFLRTFKEPEKEPTPPPLPPDQNQISPHKSPATQSLSPSSLAPPFSSPEKVSEEQAVLPSSRPAAARSKTVTKSTNRKSKAVTRTIKPARTRLKKAPCPRKNTKSSKLKQSESTSADKSPSAIEAPVTLGSKADTLQDMMDEYRTPVDQIEIEHSSPPWLMEDDSNITSPIRSTVPTSSDEDDIIDIGNPPTPPRASPPHESSYAISMPSPMENPSGYSSSPKKFFSICSETVVAQSEQVDNSYDNVHVIDSSSDADDRYHSSRSPQHIEEDTVDELRYSDHECHELRNRRDDDLASDNEQLNVDVELDSDMEQDNVENDDTRFQSYESDDDDISVTDDQDPDEDFPQAPPVVAPLRINKRHLKNCNWPDDDVNQDEKCRPIKLKINEPAPPPIKLRIKRDVNDKWEAASTLSNNVVGDDEAGVSSEEEEDYSDDQEAQYGGISVNWDNEAGEESREGTDISDEDSDHAYGEDNFPSQYSRNNVEDEESIPFASYASYSEDSE